MDADVAHAARAIDVLFGGGGTGSYTSLAEAQQELRILQSLDNECVVKLIDANKLRRLGH